MRLLALLVVSLSLLASDALALTPQLSLRACPDDPSAVSALALDCASDESIVIYMTFALSYDIPDFAAFEGALDVTLLSGNFDSLPFWDIDFSCGSDPIVGDVLSMDPARPSAGCDDYNSLPYSPLNSLASASRDNSTLIHLNFSITTTRDVALVANEKQFACRLLVNTINAVERGGSCAGCTMPVRIDFMNAQAVGSHTIDTDRWPPCAGFPHCNPQSASTVYLNSGAVPVHPHSWGQLKSLYR